MTDQEKTISCASGVTRMKKNVQAASNLSRTVLAVLIMLILTHWLLERAHSYPPKDSTSTRHFRHHFFL